MNGTLMYISLKNILNSVLHVCSYRQNSEMKTMRISIVLTVLGLCQLVSTKMSIECFPQNDNCGLQHELVCEDGLIEIQYVKLSIGIPREGTQCDCNKEDYECIINDDPGYVRQRCNFLRECNVPVKVSEKQYSDRGKLPCVERENGGPLRAIWSNITYKCADDEQNQKDSNLSSIIIAATVSALVVVTIVLIVFVVVFFYKRKASAKKESIQNNLMRASTFRSNDGFDGEYNPIPEDYDWISRVGSQHIYHTIGTSIKNDNHGSVNEAAGDDYDTTKHDDLKQHTDNSTYSDDSNYSSMNNGSYNKLKFNEAQNVPVNSGDYSHMNQHKDDYSHLGDPVDSFQPPVNDYNRLHEKSKKEENYDDAITPSNIDCNDATDTNVKNGSIKRKGSYEEPVTVDELNTDHLEADDVVLANNNDHNSLLESSDLTNQESLLPRKVLTDESDADSNSTVSCDTLQSEDGNAKTDEHESAESTTPKNINVDDDNDEKTKYDIKTDRDANNDLVESTNTVNS